MNPKSVPEDIARTIVEQIPRDRLTLKALATVSRTFTHPCQEILFRRLVINFRRRNMNNHVLNMNAFLTAKPSLRPYIHHLEITDNNMPSAHKRETSAPLIEISTPDLYSFHELCLNGDIYGLLFENRPNSPNLLPQLLDYLGNLSSISISIKNTQCSWLQFTPALGESLIRLFGSPGLRKLYIQGLMFIPILALANFGDLSELYVKECDMDLFNCDAYYDSIVNRATSKIGDGKGMRRLTGLTVQDLPTNSFQALLNHWQSNRDPHFIDMSSPRELTIYISTFRELSLIENLLQTCQESIETLTIHTWGLHLGTSFSPPSSAELGLGFSSDHSPYNWFYYAMEPLQLTQPCKLLNLTLSVSFWINTDFPEANGELEWALQVLRDFPPNNLKEITVNIRVGGEHPRDLLAFVDFQRYRGWKNWDMELTASKWWGVETFLFLACCDCGPKLIKGTDDIQSVIARQMPLLMESGKLSIGHALLGEEGLINHDIVQWIYE